MHMFHFTFQCDIDIRNLKKKEKNYVYGALLKFLCLYLF